MIFYLKPVVNEIVIRVRKVYLSEKKCFYCKINCDDCHNYVKKFLAENKQSIFFNG